MSQHDFDITTADANTGTTYRAAVNAALQALASTSAAASEPVTTYAYQLWADTTSGKLKIRNAANTAWITLLDLATSITASNTELNYMDGVSGNVQTLLNSKVDSGATETFITNDGTSAQMAHSGTFQHLVIAQSSGAKLVSTDESTTISAITAFNGKLSMIQSVAVPTSATDTGTFGELRFDANYLYRCVATNTWKRVALNTW